MVNDDLVAHIRTKQRKLLQAKQELKKHFVGLDEIIDRVIKDIETWYIMPELLTRPPIICLWGPTGVGKTDLVRRLVKCLHVQDRFCEMTLSNKGATSTPWSSSIGSILRSSNVQSGIQSVILMDEIQGFRTIDEDGNDIHDCKFKDVWTLLSDGKLPYQVEIESLMSMLWDLQKTDVVVNNKNKRLPAEGVAASERMTAHDLIDDDDDDDEDPKHDFYQLNYFKSLLRLDEPIEEIATWPDAKRKQIILKRLTDKTIFEEEDYTKCLIFISGNLDEAYGFAKDVKEVDADADILHEISKKISILDIKEALTKRFKPEQISRMGNSHVIYPSLNRESFETIIDRKIETIRSRIKTQTNIDVFVDQSIKKLIYENGVFPAQGTRPLFSTVSDILENSLPDFLLKAILKGNSELNIYYAKDAIRANVGKGEVKRRYIGVIDKLKTDRRNNVDRRTLTAVHEAGHAVAFSILFKVAPSQIVATPASNDTDGFIYTIQACQSKDMAKKRLCGMLAGQAAERIIFGVNNVTSGSGHDLIKATEKAARMVRKWGMGSYASVISKEEVDLSNNDIEGSNQMIEALIQKCKNDAEALLQNNMNLLQDVIDTLLVVDKIEPADFKMICSKHGIEIGQAISSEDVIYWDYGTAYQKFKENRKSN